MDRTEKIVEEFLIRQGYRNIVFEPDGNVPPDFVVDNKIAVEVRRLNQSFKNASKVEGLEETAIPLWKNVKELMSTLGPPTRNESWFVFYYFGRPLERWKTLKSKIRSALINFIDSKSHEQTTIKIAPNFELELFRASTLHPTFFLLGGCIDDESGGWLISEIEKNLKIYINEKTSKIQAFKAKYPEWWLVLVDHIGYGLSDSDIEDLKADVSIPHDWDKVVIIDPQNQDRFFCL